MSTPTLDGDRLVLTPLAASDAPEMHRVLASRDLYRFMGGAPPTLEQLRQQYEAQAAGSPEPGVTWHNWIIRLADDRRAVGFVQATVSGSAADLAWVVGVAWQGRGIAAEATSIMSDWLAADGVERFEAHIHPDHIASARVAAAVGLRPTGELDTDGETIWTSGPRGRRAPA